MKARISILLILPVFLAAGSCRGRPPGAARGGKTAGGAGAAAKARQPAPEPAAGLQESRPECDMAVEYDVRIPMRDGVLLSADVYRPKQEGRHPVILSRTPYNNNGEKITEKVEYFVKRCYAFVYVDCRGRHDSGGEWYPLRDEGKDGVDAIEWAAAQEWSDGKVGTYGGSYVAWNQWLAAILGPEHLVTMVSVVSPPDPFYNVPYQYGAMSPVQLDWLAFVSGRVNQDSSAVNMEEVWKHLPLVTMDEAAGRKSKIWKDWIEHYSYDGYWKEVSYQDKFSRVKVPVLHVSGWYDDDQPGTFMNFVGMRKEGGGDEARLQQKLLVGAWPHKVNSASKLGRVDFGPAAVIDLDRVVLRWFDRWLKNVPNGITEEPRVKIFVMGRNEWRDEKDWPLPGTLWTKYFLHGGGHANSLHGNGSLSTAEPAGEPPDAYSYDPADPVPFIMDPSFAQVGGPDDYRPVERRDDVLVFTSQALQEDVEVTGPVKLILYASSSAKDTDFTGMLLDVHPNGYAQRLVDGIIRARFRDSLEKPVLMQPGKIYKFEIDLWATSHVFKKGHRIRVDVSSSAFPKFDRNLNTGKVPGMDAVTAVAGQKVYHDKDHPSHILLPVIPKNSGLESLP